MTVTIQIIYRSAASGSPSMQQASFPLKGRQQQLVAYDWWQQIRREIPVDELDRVICNSDDLTDIIKEMDRKK